MPPRKQQQQHAPTQRLVHLPSLLAFPFTPWAPSISTAYAVTLGVRLFAAFVALIYDCDETFNYWEPLHFLVYGYGLQTWEYAPDNALRSYAYLLPASRVAHAARWLGAALTSTQFSSSGVTLGLPNKLLVFLAVRIMHAVVAAASETVLYAGVRRMLGRSIALVSWLFLLWAPGLFSASVAFLPSSFVMYTTMLSTGAWMLGYPTASLVVAGLGVVVGWPFVALMALPLGMLALLLFGLGFVVRAAFIIIVGIAVPVIAIDSWYYQAPTFPTLNILLYNVLQAPETGGSALYGTEPWTFYAKNLALNLNGIFPLALWSLICLIALARLKHRPLAQLRRVAAVVVSPPLLWIAFFTAQAHKEERFLFPAYPGLCVLAAVGLVVWADLVYHMLPRRWPRALITRVMVFLLLSAVAALSASRLAAVSTNYHAPPLVQARFAVDLARRPLVRPNPESAPAATQDSLNVCYGAEWYRFYSHFFLPEHDASGRRVVVRYVESGFSGQLPAPFPQHSWDKPSAPFNRMNAEEASRYIAREDCDFFFGSGVNEYDDTFTVLIDMPFVQTSSDVPSSSLPRALYVPGVSNTAAVPREGWYVAMNTRRIIHDL